jgi:hypothetical protein
MNVYLILKILHEELIVTTDFGSSVIFQVQIVIFSGNSSHLALVFNST